MSIGTTAPTQQQPLYIDARHLAELPGHPFYDKLNTILARNNFDAYAAEKCAAFYAPGKGRPSVPPGVYFRMLLVGYFEQLTSLREIAWRCADSLSIRAFLSYPLDKPTPDHSTIARIRRKIDTKTHMDIVAWVLSIDPSTLSAGRALHSVIRHHKRQQWAAFLAEVATAHEPQKEEATDV